MAIPTLIAAVLLIVVGVVGYAGQEAGHASPTALIPAGIGGVLALCGLLAMKESLRKHAMHFASLVALLGAGSIAPIIIKAAKGNKIDFAKPSVISQGLTALICLVLLAMCINSFVKVRKARRAAAANPPQA